jgi:ribose 5-phosphate isomerase B
MLKITVGSDHAGFETKEFIKNELINLGFDVIDKGALSKDSVDYPDFAHQVAKSVSSSETKLGFLFCGSGNGVCIAANKHKGIRAALAWKKEVAQLAKAHNNANILCLPARFLNNNEAIEIVITFLNTEFEGGRHQNRIDKIED